MNKITLSFTHVSDDLTKVQIFEYHPPLQYINHLLNTSRKCEELIDKKHIILCFGRYAQYNVKREAKALDLFFSMINDDYIIREVVSETEADYQVSYKFTKECEESLSKLTNVQLLFLCGVFSSLDDKKNLLALVMLLNNKGIKFEEIKKECHNEKYNIQTYCE